MNISERVKKLKLPFGKYVVVGGVMEAYGIRPAHDLDIVVSEDLFNGLRKQGWTLCECDKCKDKLAHGSTDRILKGDGVDILSEYSYGDKYYKSAAEIIQKAVIIDGVPYVPLEELVKWKKAANREKDQKDVELIEKFLMERKDA